MYAITSAARRAIGLNLVDPLTIVAVAILAIWAGITFMTEAPGWIHLLLTAGVFLLIYRIVVRGAKSGTTPSQ